MSKFNYQAQHIWQRCIFQQVMLICVVKLELNAAKRWLLRYVYINSLRPSDVNMRP